MAHQRWCTGFSGGFGGEEWEGVGGGEVLADGGTDGEIGG